MKPLMILFALVPFLSFAQKLKVNEYDRFTKQRRIELEPLRVYSSDKASLNLSYNSLGTALYLQLSGVGWGASPVDEGQKLVFLFANDTTASITSVDVQTVEMNASFQNTYKHNYFISLADLKLLSQGEVVGIRKFGLGDHVDLQLPKESAQKIKQLSALFLEELRVGNIFRPMQDIDIKDIAKHIGDSVRFCTKVYNARYFPSERNRPTVLDVKNNFNTPLNIIIWEQDRKNFGSEPEVLYNNKDVCVSGLVESFNSIPQIVVRSKEQLVLKTPISLAEADKFAGDTVTLSGKVITAKTDASASAAGTVLNLGTGPSGQPVTVVIKNSDNANVTPESYLNKAIRVTGKIEMVDGKPQMVVSGHKQIVEISEQMMKAENNVQQPSQIVKSAPAETIAPKSSLTKSFEQSASFPGGHDALLDFLKTNLICPEDELKLGQKKVVVAKFMIQPDGTASDIEITQPAGANFDKEVIRVLKMMPRWEPQMTNGTPVPVTVTQPITFVRREVDARKRAKS